jgi:hypothetical protein
MAQRRQRRAAELSGSGKTEKEEEEENDGLLALIKGSPTLLAC